MVSTIDHLATQAGLGVLRDGGSAADAAIAANAVLAVTIRTCAGWAATCSHSCPRDDAPPATLDAAGRAGPAPSRRACAPRVDEMPFKRDIAR